ncbi:MAG: MarR family transcriptional regulator [Actinomycetia bacterium]|nr:MarR family transcriptional regulator [Actinomycetes bacterium]
MPAKRKSEVAAEVWACLEQVIDVWRDDFLALGRDLHLTPGEMKALSSLDPDVQKSMRELAGAWVCDASNVTWIVDRLEARGLVERHVLAADRRVKTVVLTPEGDRIRMLVVDQLRTPPAALQHLTQPELEAMRALVQRVAAACPGADVA